IRALFSTGKCLLLQVAPDSRAKPVPEEATHYFGSRNICVQCGCSKEAVDAFGFRRRPLSGRAIESGPLELSTSKPYAPSCEATAEVRPDRPFIPARKGSAQ